MLFVGSGYRNMPSVDGVDDNVPPTGFGVRGRSNSSRGVYGYSSSGPGVYGDSGSGYGVVGGSRFSVGVRGFSNTGEGVYGSSTDGIGVLGDNFSGFGVYGQSVIGGGVYGSSRTQGAGVYGQSFAGEGVHGRSTYGLGVFGESMSYPGVHGTSVTSHGVYGRSNRAVGVYGNSVSGPALVGQSFSGNGMMAETIYGVGVIGDSYYGVGIGGASDYSVGVIATSRSGIGLYSRSTNNIAAYLDGDVTITGTFQKAGGSFKIDHPLDPGNKYLSHSFVESPDMKNIYDGITVLDSNGEAEIELPAWFDALNKDFRYQLTAIGAPRPNLYIAEEISDGVTNKDSNNNNNNRFKIAGGTPHTKVSWQVTGIRRDPWANAHRIQVEEDKSEHERGYYIYPDLYGKSDENGISRLLFPEEELLINENKQLKKRKDFRSDG